jgi:hypothetical protein
MFFSKKNSLKIVNQLIALLILALSATGLLAQSNSGTVGAAAPVGLQDFEVTFNQELKKIHAPLLSGYLLSLQALLRSAGPTERPAVQAEIVRVQKLIASGAAMDLALVAEALKNTTPGAAALPVGLAGMRAAGAVLELKAEQAVEFSPTGVSPETLLLGSASWGAGGLAAGDYEVLAQYSCPNLSADPAVLRVALGAHAVEMPLKADRATKSGLDFKILRIGRLHLPEPAANEMIKLTLAGPKEVQFRVQRLILARKQEKTK